ncbi:hypothetical protein ASE00_13405 [Sphingomonas sp. Root710]|nr:hypothetical protein ASE00_13405 [Sphingomonas sp. Root710]
MASVLDGVVSKTPDSIALVGRHGALTYQALDAQVHAAAAMMASRCGITPGMRVAASCGNHVELIVAFLAVQRLGAIWVGINKAYAPPEKSYLIKDSGASLFLCDQATAEIAQSWDAVVDGTTRVLQMEPGRDDCTWSLGLQSFMGATRPAIQIDPFAPAAIAYTSGTTGFPKGVVHSQHNMMLTALISTEYSGDGVPETVRGTALPLTILNLMILGPLAAFATGARHVNLDRIDAAGVAEWIAREKIANISLVPTIAYDLLTKPDIDQDDLRSLRWLVIGGSSVPKKLPDIYRKRFGRRMTVGYGLTEGPNGVAKTHEHSPDVAGVIGRPLPHLDMAILDEQGTELPRGSTGEIAFRPAQAGRWAHIYTPALGYWRNPEATAKLLRNGWVHTGDVGLQDEAGEFHIRDRGSDLILRGGANIYPAEVERVLRMHAGVRDCAVLGRPDERLGQTVAAFIEPADPGQPENALIETLAQLCADNLAAYKCPAHWHVCAMPRNAMGKIVKTALTDRLNG